MVEIATYVVATSDVMPMPMGKIILRCGRENVDLSRIASRGGLPYLSNHDSDMPLGMFYEMVAKGNHVEGSAETVITPRNAEYLAEVRAGIRRECSPAFLIDLDSIEAEEDPDDRDGYIAVINRWAIYEGSAVTTPVGQNAGLLSIGERSARASMAPADLKEQVNTEVAAQVSALRDRVEAETERVREGVMRLDNQIAKVKNTQPKAQAAAAGLHNGKSPKPESAEAEAEPAWTGILRYMLHGTVDGSTTSTEGVKEFTGDGGKWSTVRLAFDTSTAYGTIGTGGVDMAGDKFFETSPARILSLPMQLDNLERDQQIPVLTSEPNSAMATEGAQRLAVVDGVFDSTPPTMKPARLQTVADFSLETHLVSPGFESFLMAAMLAASDRQMAVQVLTGDGTAPNIRGILNTPGVLSTAYAVADKGAQGGFFDAEDSLAVDVPADRRFWILAEDLFRFARRTLRDPGDATYVLRRWDATLRVLDDSPAIRTNTLTAGYGVYAEWSAATLATWEDVAITVNRVSKPGTIQITLDRWWNFSIQRPARFSVLQPA